MSEESKIEDKASKKEPTDAVVNAQASKSNAPKVESEDEDEVADGPSEPVAGAPTATSKKKKSKRKRMKAALTGGSKSDDGSKDEISKAVGNLSKSQIADLLAMNPALAQELGTGDGDLSGKKTAEALKKLTLQDIMTGLAAGGKNAKDMASYKFWATQPVPKLNDQKYDIEEGPFKIVEIEKVPKQPSPLPDGYEWVTVDLAREEELKEVFELLNGHYVEDEEAMFRFNYSPSFLKWALLAPGWTKEWHVGVRTSESRRLVAFISAVPVALRVRQKTLRASEVNFLCIHKKLRSKRLAPVLIKEITRRCYLTSVWQAIYTAGVVLPTPVSTCRYYHRSLDWQKLYDVGFSPLPPNSKPQYQVRKFALPDHTSTKGLRPLEPKDVDVVLDLLKRYLARFDMAPVFTKEEFEHWLIHDEKLAERVIWSYVVEDPNTKQITDYFSFYGLESTVIKSAKHDKVRAAYLFYYATETAFQSTPDPSMSGKSPASSSKTSAADTADTKVLLKVRLNALINDALILAKKSKFDVFNSLSLMDNALFIEQQKFGRGDGQLHYYLYNYNANHIRGGVDARNEIDEVGCSGVGVVML